MRAYCIGGYNVYISTHLVREVLFVKDSQPTVRTDTLGLQIPQKSQVEHQIAKLFFRT